MASMTVYSPDKLINQLRRISDIDNIAPKILDAGIEPLESEIKTNASKHSHGEMLASIKRKKAKKNKDGTWGQRVEFAGYDKTRNPTTSDPRGVPNARKAMSLEYGTSKQPATPFIRPAVVTSESKCIDKMQDEFNKEANRI